MPRDACRFAAVAGRTAFWLGPDEWLLDAGNRHLKRTSRPRSVNSARSRIRWSTSATARRHRDHGSRSAYVLNHGCPLDLSLKAFPVGMCTRTIFGKATIMLWRPEESAFRLEVWRSFAPYVWQLLDEARGELACGT